MIHNELKITSVKKENDEINGGTLHRLTVVIDGETLTVPQTVGNIHYDEIMRQVKEGILPIKDAD